MIICVFQEFYAFLINRLQYSLFVLYVWNSRYFLILVIGVWSFLFILTILARCLSIVLFFFCYYSIMDILPTPYSSSSQLLYFITESFYLLSPFIYFALSPTHLLSVNHQFVLHLKISLFGFLDSNCMKLYGICQSLPYFT